MLIDKFTYYLVHNNDARVADKYIYERIKEKEQESIKRAELAHKNMMRGTLECHCIGFDVSGMKECCKHYKDDRPCDNSKCALYSDNIEYYESCQKMACYATLRRDFWKTDKKHQK